MDSINIKPACVTKWAKTFPDFETADTSIWERIFTMAFTIFTQTKIQAFQYRLIHRVIPCNKWLCDIKVKDSNICNYCNRIDNLLHFFLYCDNVHTFWVSLYKWWNRTTEIVISDETEIEECILFGYYGESDIVKVLNFVIIHAKYYIYRQRLYQNNNIEFYDFLMILKYKLKQMKCILEYKNQESIFEPYLVLLNAY